MNAAARSRRRWVLLFLSPWIIGFAAFVLYPMGASLYYSFTHYDILSAPRFRGLENYRYMLSGDRVFWTAVRNTAWMIVIAVPVQVVFALSVASLLARPRRGGTLYRTIAFLPSVVPPVAATLVFAYLLDPGVGPVNRVLHTLHLPTPLWFHDPSFAKPGLVLLGLWGVGPSIVIFMAGLRGVPAELYELAAVEGAGRWQRFRHVTVPLISPVLLFSVVIGTIGSFQYFTEALVASRAASPNTSLLGAPQNSTMFFAVWLYKQAFVDFDLGYASALAWVLLLATMLAIFVIIRAARRWIHLTEAIR